MPRRRYPRGLTEAQRKMMRRVELGPFEPTARQQARIETLVRRGCLVRRGGWYEHAPDLLPVMTYFVQEEYGSIKIGVSPAHLQVIERMRTQHPRPLTFLGIFEGDWLKQIKLSCNAHHMGDGWYRPHADVLHWTQHEEFQKA